MNELPDHVFFLDRDLGRKIFPSIPREASLARGFLTNLPSIIRFLERHDPPFIAKIYLPTESQPKGRVKMWLSYEDWLKRPEA